MNEQLEVVESVSLLDAAMDILHDKCPRSREFYLCNYQQDVQVEPDCTRCLEYYLLYLANGRTDRPYAFLTK